MLYGRLEERAEQPRLPPFVRLVSVQPIEKPAPHVRLMLWNGDESMGVHVDQYDVRGAPTCPSWPCTSNASFVPILKPFYYSCCFIGGEGARNAWQASLMQRKAAHIGTCTALFLCSPWNVLRLAQ